MFSAMVTRIGPRKPRRHFIREWMEERGIPSQTELANRIGEEGVSVAAVNRWIHGSRALSEGVKQALARALRLPDTEMIYKHPNSVFLDVMIKDQPREVQERVRDVVASMLGKTAKRAS